MKLVKKPATNFSIAAKAKIVRALYDAADKAYAEHDNAVASPGDAALALNELQNVIEQARALGDAEFSQTVETALNKYTKQASIALSEGET